MSKKIVMTIMLGMNRFSEEDTKHPFDMSHAEKFNILWMPQVSAIEKNHSTPIYEITKSLYEFMVSINQDYNRLYSEELTVDDFLFIIGRGTIGDSSEENLIEAILEARRTYGYSAYYVFYAKSFGVVDTLRAFNILIKEAPRFKADLLVCIDGYATAISRNSVSKIYDINGKKERRFFIPSNVKTTYSAVQRKEGFKGLQVGSFTDVQCRNHIITQTEVNKVTKYYDHYADGYKRKLNVSHYNMEEIVSVIPCFLYSQTMYTANDLIKKYCKKYIKI